LLFCHLSDIFDKLNGLNSSLQGPNATVFQLFDKVWAFMKKTMLWKSLCESDTQGVFVNMSEYLEENDYVCEEFKPYVLTHLTNLESNFKNRFQELTLQQHERMRNPFAVTIGEKISHLSIKAKESLMELSCDRYISQDQV
jgi:plasmid replication initiation protein